VDEVGEVNEAQEGRRIREFTVLRCKLLVSDGERRGEGLPLRHRGHRAGLDDGRDRSGTTDGDGGWRGRGRGRGLGGCGATFTAHDSRRGTRGQLYGVTVEVQLN